MQALFTKLFTNFRKLLSPANPIVENEAGSAISENNITHFEELLDVRYNPVVSKLEATILIHDTTGYNGNICFGGSTEYVRFFVDQGEGFENVGFTSVQVYDLTDEACKSRMPQKHLLQLYFEGKRLQDAEKQVRIKAVLSWNQLPPVNPAWAPVFGNSLESFAILQSSDSIVGDLSDELVFPKQYLFSYTW